MILNLTVFAGDSQTEKKFGAELKQALSGIYETHISTSTELDLSQVIFVMPSARSEAFLQNLDKSGQRRGKAVFLLVAESKITESEIPIELEEGLVDDVLVYPFRKLEVLSRIRHYQQLLMWDEVHQMNSSLSELIGQLKNDLKLAERLQKSNLPVRFPDIRGIKVTQRYLAGLRSGGDHFDLAESRDGNQVSLVLSDSSSYGLSSSVLSILMKVTLKLSAEESRSSSETVRRIQEELKATLGEKDRLSLFYGVLSRKDYKLRYLNLGSAAAFYAPSEGKFRELNCQAGPVTANFPDIRLDEAQLPLDPGGRFVLVSDGFMEAIGNAEMTCKFLDEYRESEPNDALTEMVFRVKKLFIEDDDLPAQDCTAVIFDIDTRIIRSV